MGARRWTALARLSGPRVVLGQQEIVRLPFIPQPAAESLPAETVLAQRERAHAKLSIARRHAEGVARQAEMLVRLLGLEKTAAILDETALSIERAEEAYIAAEAVLQRARVATETARMLQGGRSR